MRVALSGLAMCEDFNRRNWIACCPYETYRSIKKRTIEPRATFDRNHEVVSRPGKVVFIELKDVVGPCFVMNCGQNTWIKMSTGRTLPDDFDTRVSFLATSQLEARARNPLFERAVFCFRYKNAKMMQALRAVLVDVNRRALPGCSVRSYQLTPEQAAAADNGELDIITGFQVVDDAFRLVVMEGLGASAMKELRARMPREAANHPRCKIFTNPGLRFKKRLYTPFHVDLKIIHLRESLPAIVRSPEIYNRVKVSEDCFEALHCVVPGVPGPRPKRARRPYLNRPVT